MRCDGATWSLREFEAQRFICTLESGWSAVIAIELLYLAIQCMNLLNPLDRIEMIHPRIHPLRSTIPASLAAASSSFDFGPRSIEFARVYVRYLYKHVLAIVLQG